MYAVGLWALAVVGIVSFWVWLNLERDPSVEAGVAFGAGIVALLLVGVNAWFLRTLLTGLAVTRAGVDREISPYLIPRFARSQRGANYVGTVAGFRNAGRGTALRCHFTAFRLFDVSEFPGEVNLHVDLGPSGRGVVADYDQHLVLEPQANHTPELGSRVVLFRVNLADWVWEEWVYFLRSVCYDQEARRHERWFFQDEDGSIDEIQGGEYRLGAMPEPPPLDDDVDRVARGLRAALVDEYPGLFE